MITIYGCSTRREITRKTIKTLDGDKTRVLFDVSPEGRIRGRAVLHGSAEVADPTTGQLPLQWSASQSSVSLTWWHPLTADVEWTIERDGQEIARQLSNAFIDRSGDRHAAHHYVVRGQSRSRGAEASTDFYYEVFVPETDVSAIGLSINDPRTLSPASNQDVHAFAAAYPVAHAKIRYRAFIAPKYVTTSICDGLSQGYFGGDNRSWSANMYSGGSSRLGGAQGIEFYSDSVAFSSFDRGVGTTKQYNKDYELIKSKTASIEGVYRGSLQTTSSAAEGNIYFSSANPLCLPGTPAINGILTFEVRNSGFMNVLGNHDQAPSHEILYYWFKDGTTKTGCVYRKAHKTFAHLAAPAPNAYYDITWNPARGDYPTC